MGAAMTMHPREAGRAPQAAWGQLAAQADELDLPNLTQIHTSARRGLEAVSANVPPLASPPGEASRAPQAGWSYDAAGLEQLDLPRLEIIHSIAYRVLEGYLRSTAAINLTEMLTIHLEDQHLDHLKIAYQNKIKAIFWQAIVQVVSAVVGGGCSIAAGFTADNVKSVLEGLGKALPQFGQVGVTFLRRGEVAADCDITVEGHLLTRIQAIIKNDNTILDRIQQSFSRIQDETQKSYALK
jgi:hypothetical protein